MVSIIHPWSTCYGRIVAQDIKDPISGQLLLKQGDPVMRDDVERITDSAVTRVPIRCALVCQAKRGVCAKCYGIDLSKGELVDVGTTVGIIAAQSIGEPGTQLTMRTFHVGGIASLAEQSSYVAKLPGVVQIRDGRTVTNREGKTIVLSRKAKLIVLSLDGRELQRHDLEYGTQLDVTDGQQVEAGTKLVEWDAHNKVLLTEQAGKIRYVDLIENVTIQDRFDETTGRSTKMILESKGDLQPAISIVNEQGEELLSIIYQPMLIWLLKMAKR